MEIALINGEGLTEKQNKLIGETVRRERSRLFAFIRRRIADAGEAEDILQDVFYELTEMYRMLHPVERATAWLFRVARNKITDRSRKKRPEMLEDAMFLASDADSDDDALQLADLLPGLDASPEDELLRNTILEALGNALDDLPEEQRSVFVAHELEGKSFNEISVATGVSVNTLLSRKRYAVLYLRERLRDLYNEVFQT